MNVHTITKQENRFVIKLDKSIEQIIDSDTRKKLVNAYLKLFSGFAWVNWTKKQSLGCAWQNAFTQCNAFLKTKNKANYATKYLYSVAKAHKAYQSRIIMTNENSPNTINKTPDEIKRLQQYGQKQIREAMDTINLIMTRYNEHIEELTGHEQTSIRTTHYTKSNQKQSAQHALQPQVATTATQMPQAKPIQQLQPMEKQHTLQPQVATTAMQMPQAKSIQQLQQMEKQHALQPRVATIAKQMPQAKPIQQLQPMKKQHTLQPRVATTAKQMPQVKPIQQLQPMKKQHALQPWVATTAKQMPQAKPIQQLQPMKKQHALQPWVATTATQMQNQLITKLNSAENKQIVQHRINMFIMAKYNQKSA